MRLTEQDRLQILFPLGHVTCRSAVGKGVVALDYDESALFVLIIERGAVRIGDAGPVQDNRLFLGSIYFKEAVGSGPREFIYEHFATSVVHSDLVAVHVDIAV